jgi:ferredoxin
MNTTAPKPPFQAVDLACFSGTGNTLLAARRLAEVLRAGGVAVRLHRLETADPATVARPGAVLGLAFPVSAFTTYPIVWRFVEALPPGEGRPVFMLSTMASFSGLLVGPLKDLLRRRGYLPVAARQVRMPANYLFAKPFEASQGKLARGLAQAERYAQALLAGSARWRRFSPWPYSWVRRFWRGIARTMVADGRRFRVDGPLCTRCGLCVRLCPVMNITLAGPVPTFAERCEQCQRCIAFCPTRAIRSSAHAHGRYRAVAAAELLKDEPA